MFIFIFIPTLIAYFTVGLLVSRKYHGRKAIEWEKGYAECDQCSRYGTLTSRDHHSLCHDSRGKYLFASWLLFLYWPLLFPFMGVVSGSRSFKDFYLAPVDNWKREQEDLIKQRDLYRKQVDNTELSESERAIFSNALKGIESQIVKVRKQ